MRGGGGGAFRNRDRSGRLHASRKPANWLQETAMRELAGKTAFVTGGAGGIGLALGRAFAQNGMKVMLADIDAETLQAAVRSLKEIGPDIRGTVCDGAHPASAQPAAPTTLHPFRPL